MTRERRSDNRDWPAWLDEAWNKPVDEVGAVSPRDYPISSGTDPLTIQALEGLELVEWDAWIVRGIKGELYPVRDDIFRALYDEVVE